MKQLLEKNFIIKILSEKCKQEDKYYIKTSFTSNSLYVTVFNKYADVTFRVSDHRSTKSKLKSLIIGNSTKKETVENFIANNLKTLQSKTLEAKLKLISKK